MINLAKDFFVHMAISAKVIKEDDSKQGLVPKKIVMSNLETASYGSANSVHINPPKITDHPKTIEETIEEVVKNPKVKELKKELDAVEEIFEKIRGEGDNIDFIYRMENKISQLRKIIDQKSY